MLINLPVDSTAGESLLRKARPADAPIPSRSTLSRTVVLELAALVVTSALPSLSSQLVSSAALSAALRIAWSAEARTAATWTRVAEGSVSWRRRPEQLGEKEGASEGERDAPLLACCLASG